jgi:hypothetical protein
MCVCAGQLIFPAVRQMLLNYRSEKTPCKTCATTLFNENFLQ